MSKTYELIKSLGERFHGCDDSRKKNYGNVSTVTPEKDGWMRVVATTNSGQTIQPIIDITQNGDSIGRGVGLTVSGSAVVAFAPVKAGTTYGITVYRASIQEVVLYY